MVFHVIRFIFSLLVEIHCVLQCPILLVFQFALKNKLAVLVISLSFSPIRHPLLISRVTNFPSTVLSVPIFFVSPLVLCIFIPLAPSMLALTLIISTLGVSNDPKSSWTKFAPSFSNSRWASCVFLPYFSFVHCSIHFNPSSFGWPSLIFLIIALIFFFFFI